jgi:vacuolar-type H+-ATPase subunit E/Vma4
MMSGPTLADELRRKANSDVEALWAKARADADACRAAQQRLIEEKRSRAAEASSHRAASLEQSAAADAEREARKTRAAAKSALADRLYALAVEALPRFRNSDYQVLFRRLAEELPPLAWKRVRVNPADESFAATLFPATAVSVDPSIAGGMEAEAEDGRVKVTNTLEARLQNAWPEILPGLVNEIMEEVSHSQPRA